MIYIVLLFVIGVLPLLIKYKKDEGYAYLFFASGIQLIVSTFGTPLDKILYFFGFELEQNLFSKIAQFVVGAVFILIAWYFLKQIKHRICILNIQGRYGYYIEDHYRSLKMRKFEFKEREIDIIYERKSSMTEEKAKTILSVIERKVASFINESKGYLKGFTAIADIPFVLYAGTLLKGQQIDDYFEYDRKIDTYYRLGKGKQFPELKYVTESKDYHAEEVVLAVCTTDFITDRHLKQFQQTAIVRLSVETPMDNIIRSKPQLMRYKNVVMEAIHRLPSEFPNLKKIHLVCATQGCLLVEIGKLMTDYRMVPVIGYHFDIENEKNYPWGIVLNGHNRGDFVRG